MEGLARKASNRDLTQPSTAVEWENSGSVINRMVPREDLLGALIGPDANRMLPKVSPPGEILEQDQKEGSQLAPTAFAYP